MANRTVNVRIEKRKKILRFVEFPESACRPTLFTHYPDMQGQELTLLVARAKKRDIGAHAVLRRYERWRKGDNLSMIAVTGGFKYLFGNDLPIVRDLRNFGLDLTDRVTPIKNRIIRRAAGLEGDLPRLARVMTRKH